MRLLYPIIISIGLLSGCATSGDWSSDTPTKGSSKASKATRVNLSTQSVSKLYAPSDNLWLRIRDGFQMQPMNSPLEIEQVRLLASKPGRVYRRDEILATVWQNESPTDDRTLDTHIYKIREKIGDRYIKTIKGVGYKVDY